MTCAWSSLVVDDEDVGFGMMSVSAMGAHGNTYGVSSSYTAATVAIRSLLQRQLDAKSTLAHFAGHADLPAVLFDDALGDRQAQARCRPSSWNNRRRRSAASASGAMPRPVSMTSMTASAVVARGRQDHLPAALGHRLQRVDHQVEQRLLDEPLVERRRPARRRRASQPELHALELRLRREEVDQLLQQVVQLRPAAGPARACRRSGGSRRGCRAGGWFPSARCRGG